MRQIISFISIILLLFICLLFATKTFASSFTITNFTFNHLTKEYFFNYSGYTGGDISTESVAFGDVATGSYTWQFNHEPANCTGGSSGSGTCSGIANYSSGIFSCVNTVWIQIYGYNNDVADYIAGLINPDPECSELNPTPTPTTIPIHNLNVPSLLQTANPWQAQVYDGANYWSPSAKTINYWGCALTSYTMILKYFNINKLPDGTSLDPGTLNTWLKNNHGYIDGKNSGYVNPLAIASLSKKAKQINNISSYDALEYSRLGGNNVNALTSDLENNIPAILEEPGHYIVAKGISGNTFNINDPYYHNRTDLTSYGNTFLSMGQLTPSNTDLSYILISGNQDMEFNLTNSNSNSVGDRFLQTPLVNDSTNQPGGIALQMLLLQKPTDSNYKLHLTTTNSGEKNINIFFYDKDGNVNEQSITFFLNTSSEQIVDINFDTDNLGSSKSTRIVTFDTLINDLKEAKNLNMINNLFNPLLTLANTAQKNYERNLNLITKTQLKAMKVILNAGRKFLIKPDAYQILIYDVNYLEKNI